MVTLHPELIAQNQEIWQELGKKLKSYNLILFNNFLPFGTCFFKNQILRPENIRLFNTKIYKELQTEFWSISISDQKVLKNVYEIFSLMVESQTKGLEIKGLPMPGILRTISTVKFHFLSTLNLYKCQIVSIQALTFLDAPNLKTLNLIYNFINEFKSLNKVNFKLERLFIYERAEKQTARTKFNIRLDNSERWNTNLSSLRSEKYRYNSIIMQDLSFLAKLKRHNSQPLETIISMYTRRILQRKLYQQFFDQTTINLFVFDLSMTHQDEPSPQLYMQFKNFHALNIKRQ